MRTARVCLSASILRRLSASILRRLCCLQHLQHNTSICEISSLWLLSVSHPTGLCPISGRKPAFLATRLIYLYFFAITNIAELMYTVNCHTNTHTYDMYMYTGNDIESHMNDVYELI